MNYWNIQDGALILMTFTESLTGVVENNQNHFTISWQEYNFVPGGVLITKTGSAKSTSSGNLDTQVVLEMNPLERFYNAVGNLTVSYDGTGTLAGDGGSVEAFEVSFPVVELLAKPNQNEMEHIEIYNSSVFTLLTHVYYDQAQGQEHLNIGSASWTGTLTYIGDL